MTGDRATALTCLRETETALSHADNRRDAVGGDDQAAYSFHEAHVRWHLRDPGGSIKALCRSNAARGPWSVKGGCIASKRSPRGSSA